MGKIVLKNMRFIGCHGVLKEENRLGQEFQVDVELFLNLEQAIKTDNVDNTINYSKVYRIVKDCVENSVCKLIEKLAGQILDKIKVKYEDKIEKAVVRVRKPSAPIYGIFDYAEVEVDG